MSYPSNSFLAKKEVAFNKDFNFIRVNGSYSAFKMRIEDDYLVVTKNEDGTSSSFYLTDGLSVMFKDYIFRNIKKYDSPIGSKDVVYLDQLDERITIREECDEKGNIIKSYVIPTKLMLENDFDLHNRGLEVRDVKDSVGGAASLETDNVVFTQTASYEGLMSFRYVLKAGQRETPEDKSPFVYLVPSNLPQDENFVDQWYLHALGVPNVWKYYTGKGVKVAVFDSGYPLSHEDIVVQNEQVYDLDYPVPLDGDEVVTKIVTHSLNVAGIIGASKNGKYCVGVAYDADLYNYQVGGDEEGIMRTRVPKEIAREYDVINNSWGCGAFEDNDSVRHFLDLFEDVSSKGRDGYGTNVIFSGGNEGKVGKSPSFGALVNSPYVIVVGGVDKPEKFHFMEKEGLKGLSEPGASLLVSAPWDKIVTLNNNIFSIESESVLSYLGPIVEGLKGLSDPEASSLVSALLDKIGTLKGRLSYSDTTVTIGGTSFSAPIVSGVIALMLKANSNLGWRDIQEILAYSAKKVNYEDSLSKKEMVQWFINGAKNCNGGGMPFNYLYGHGIVDAEAAVKLAETWPVKQTSDNLRRYSSRTRQPNMVNSKGIAIPLDANEDLTIEKVVLKVDLGFSSLKNLDVELVSPSGTRSVLAKQPFTDPVTGEGGLNHNKPGTLTWDFLSESFRSEQSKGTWYVEVKVTPWKNQNEAEVLQAKVETKSCSLDIYAKEKGTPEQMIYTKEFPRIIKDLEAEDEKVQQLSMDEGLKASKLNEIKLKHAQRTTIDETSNATIINTAAINTPVKVDLSSCTKSDIAGIPVSINHGHHVRTVITGDGDDIIYGRVGGETSITAGRGNNTIYLASEDNNGDDNVLHYPLLGRGEIHDTVYNFSPVKGDKLDLDTSLVHTITCEGDDSVISGDDWSIRVVDYHMPEGYLGL